MSDFLRQFAHSFAALNKDNLERLGELYSDDALLRDPLHVVHANLQQARHKLEQLGYDEHFYRLWEFYLCYCEGGFIERTIGTAQLLLAKPAAQPQPLLGNFDA